EREREREERDLSVGGEKVAAWCSLRAKREVISTHIRIKLHTYARTLPLSLSLSLSLSHTHTHTHNTHTDTHSPPQTHSLLLHSPSMEDRVYPSYNNGGAAQNNGNGYKGFNYSYPLQQPESPVTPRRGRRRCCICCCWSLLVIIILLCIGAALVYFLMKPKAPKYTIGEATVTTFNLTSENRLTTDIKFVIKASNPNKQVKFFFSSGSVETSYEGADIGEGSIPAFQQEHKSTTLVSVQVRGRNIALKGTPASDLKKGLSKKSNITLKLKAKTHVRVKIGSLKSWKQKIKLTCDISMTVPSKAGKAQITSSTCKIKNP
ncbi:hypothetical protein GOP47_0023112, partial [Adiantum capillus-veneris]